MERKLIALCAGVAVVSFLLGQVRAQDEGGDMGGQMPPFAQKTKQHEELKESVGAWDVAGEMFMQPGAPGMKFTATATREMILGGNYATEVFKGSFGGMPYEGRLLQGYDTVRQEYVSVWVDTWSPVPSITRGKMVDGALVMHGEDPDMTGTLRKTRQVIKFAAEDKVSMSFFQAAADGQEHLVMTLAYSRKKG